MKTLKIIFAVLFTITIVNTGYSQVGSNYKQPYNRTEQTTLKTQFELSTRSQNYKQAIYKVRIIQKVNNLVCCSEKSANAFFSQSNYKQPYSTSIENSCIQGFVCNGKVTLDCCKN